MKKNVHACMGGRDKRRKKGAVGREGQEGCQRRGMGSWFRKGEEPRLAHGNGTLMASTIRDKEGLNHLWLAADTTKTTRVSIIRDNGVLYHHWLAAATRRIWNT